jgi:alpha-beta hydrolase superfamily lysophospholipase
VYKLTGLLARDHSYVGGLFSSRSQRMEEWKWEVNKLNGDYFLNNDGLLIFVRSWTLTRSPKACIIILHGLTEHSGLYDQTARALNEQDYVVIAMDLQGHGRSEGDRFYVKRFKDYVEDAVALVLIAKEKFPNLDIFILGHSMAGLIAIATAEKLQKELKGLVLSAPILASPSIPKDATTKAKAAISGALGEFLPHLALFEMDASNLVKSEKVRSILENDPLRVGKVPVRTDSELLDNISPGNDAAKTIKLPLLIVHGAADQLAPMAGSEAFVKAYIHSDKSLLKIPGALHNVLLEENGAETLKGITRWLGAHLSPSLAPWANNVTNTMANAIKQGFTQLKQ